MHSKSFIYTLKKNLDLLEGLSDSQKNSNVGMEFYHRLATLGEKLSAIKHKYFFVAQSQFRHDIEQLSATWTDKPSWLTLIADKIELFSEIYDSFLGTRKLDDAYRLLIAAQKLHTEIDAMYGAFNLILSGFKNIIRSDEESTLTLYFAGYLSAREIAEKLIALENIYKEACDLMSVSMVDFPLKVAKLESGSFWITFIGSATVVATMTSWIESSALFVYRNYTDEGKISTVPQNVEKIDALLKLRQKLKEANIDTSQLDEHIGKSSVSIASNLQVLLDGQGIKVNDNWISPRMDFAKSSLKSIEYSGLGKIDMDERPALPPPSK